MQPEIHMSKKKRRALRAQTLAALGLAALFILTAVPALILANLENRLFSPKTYQTALEESGIYENLPGMLARQLHYAATYDTCAQNPMACRFPYTNAQARACLEETLGKELVDLVARNERRPTPAQTRAAQTCFDQFGKPPQGAPPPALVPGVFTLLPPQQLESLLNTITPPDELRTFVEQTTEDTFIYLGGDARTLTLRLDWLSHGLRTRGPETLLQIIRSLPPCTPNQALEIARAVLENKRPETLLRCNPGENALLLLSPFFSQVIHVQAALIPKSVTVGEMPAPAGLAGLDGVQALTLLRQFSRYFIVAPILLLISLALVIVRSPRAWLLWLGAPLTIVGILSLGLSALGIPLLSNYTEQQISAGLPPTLMPEIAQTLHTLVVEIIGNLLAPVTVQSIAISAIGLIMLTAARFVRK